MAATFMCFNYIAIIIILTSSDDSMSLKIPYGRWVMTTQSGIFGYNNSTMAIDGDTSTCSIVKHGIKSKEAPWWRIRLMQTYNITNVEVLFVHNSTYSDFMNNLEVHVSNPTVSEVQHICNSSTTNQPQGYYNIECKKPARGNVITIKRIGGMFRMFLILCEVQIYSNLDSVNLAHNMPTSQSGILFADTGKLAVDGNHETCTKVGVEEGKFATWTVALEDTFYITHVIVYFKIRQPEIIDFNYFKVFVSVDDDNFEELLCASFEQPNEVDLERIFVNFTCKPNSRGKYVTLKKYRGVRPHWLMFCEVEVFSNKPFYECFRGARKCDLYSSCIQKEFVCDKQIQCPDGSDEINCGCSKHQYQCRDGLCIHNDWLCDGTKDCPHGDDETTNCKNCDKNEFKCLKFNLCIDLLKRCDGVQDCPDISDEDKCFNPEGNFLIATYMGESGFHVCSTNWDYQYSFYICQGLLDKFFVESNYSKASEKNPKILVLKYLRTKTFLPSLTLFEKSATCESKEFVRAKCVPTGSKENHLCGRRGIPDNLLGPYIINGDKARRGAWPWHAQIIVQGYHVCGGSIINENWILTSAHCVYNLRTNDVVIRFGTVELNDFWSPLREITHIVTNPEYNHTFKSDIALVRLKEPITFNEVVRPICLPSSLMDYRVQFSLRNCVATGFGSIDRNNSFRRYLIQGRMNLMKDGACARNIEKLNIMSMLACAARIVECRLICAGSAPTKYGINTCSGDSGGPLACKHESGYWILVGVTTGFMMGEDNVTCTNSFFARVDRHLDFISSVLKEEVDKLKSKCGNVVQHRSLLPYLVTFLLLKKFIDC